MTGKEALDDYKDFGKIKGESITSNHTFVPSDYHYEWKKEKNLEEQLTKYKRAFEILNRDKELTLHKGKEPILGTDEYKLSFVNWKSLTKEEYELLEELMKNENSKQN